MYLYLPKSTHIYTVHQKPYKISVCITILMGWQNFKHINITLYTHPPLISIWSRNTPSALFWNTVLIITHKTNVLQIWRTAITPQSVFFLYQILVSGHQTVIIKLLWDSGQMISRSSTCQNEARCRRIHSFDFNYR